MRRAFISAIVISGLSAMVAQILLLRELLIVFRGNELNVGIILANWVALEAAGALFLGRIVDKIKDRLKGFIWLLLVFSISFPVVLYLCRTLKEILNITVGAELGFGWIFSLSFLILLPLSFSHGGLFTFGCRIYHSPVSQPGRSIGRVYAWETLGSIFGGLAFTCFFVRHLNSFQTVLIISLLNLFLCLILLNFKIPPDRFLKSLTAVFFIACLYLVFSPGAEKIHQFSINKQWRKFQLLDYQNSIYGNVAVTRRCGQHSFFFNGVPVLTVPYPDAAFIEEFGNIPLLFHPRPRNILIINSGAGGVINEILKHPIKNIDYLELDPLILEMIRKYPVSLTEKELIDQRVNVKNLDGRRFVEETTDTYDLILIGITEPSDLQKNKLFTEEFFSLTKKRLRKKGILAFTLPGSLSYLNPQLRDVNSCIFNSLKKIYPFVRVIPGDNNLFLASKNEDILKAGPELLVERIGCRKLKTNLLSLSYLRYRFGARRLGWFLDTLKSATGKTNKDFRPLAVFKYSSFWNTRFSPQMEKVFSALEKINLKVISALILALSAAIYLAYSLSRRFKKVSVAFSIFTTGFFGMLINLILIFGFQIRYGCLYYQIGLLLTAFMSGIALGSIFITNSLSRIKRNFLVFLILEFLVILLAVVLPLVIAKFSKPFFLAFCFMTGLAVGSQFPLANKMYLGAADETGSGAGFLYGSDLFGGWLAGMLGGVVLLPVLGLVKTCLVVIILKFASLAILSLSRRNLISKF
ncbi:MAG: spermine synthase [Candidatus Omnitrophota bacterium]|nr:spermine synthase [Candidatus Omnitrophota bacterium]